MLTIAANSGNRFTLHLQSLLANYSAGAASKFDPLQNHRYTLVSTSGGILGFASDEFSIDASGFSNALYGGQWSVAVSRQSLMLDYTAAAAVPEQGT